MYVTLYKKGETPKQVPELDANEWVAKFGWSKEPVKDSEFPVETGDRANPDETMEDTDKPGDAAAIPSNDVVETVKSTTKKLLGK